MKTALRILAAAVALVAAIWWLAAGADRGWTKTSVQKQIQDEVTGLVGVAYEKRFVPGVDFLAVAFIGAGVFAGISFLLPGRPSRP